ncbi:MAG: hypothetical protein JWM27_3475 [Gemmatimonadetes bacterium]|nr:hypothetical protein [Gemmatimonadota bacterium]
MSAEETLDRMPDPDDHTEGADALDLADVATAGAEVGRLFPAGALGIDEFGPASEDAEFAHLDPGKVVSPKLLSAALDFFRKHRDNFPNQAVVSVLDYALQSTHPRFHVIDMGSGQVWSLRMANGKGSEPDHDGFAHKFSNVPGSLMSSLGFVRTGETYQGKHGLSLRLDGLLETNSNLRARSVVVHGAAYVKDAPVVQGRSEGCPAVPADQKDALIAKLKDGSLMYAGLGG